MSSIKHNKEKCNICDKKTSQFSRCDECHESVCSQHLIYCPLEECDNTKTEFKCQKCFDAETEFFEIEMLKITKELKTAQDILSTSSD